VDTITLFHVCSEMGERGGKKPGPTLAVEAVLNTLQYPDWRDGGYPREGGGSLAKLN
jgi:hypothetical protein